MSRPTAVAARACSRRSPPPGPRPAYWYALVIKINALVGGGDLASGRRAYDELMTVTPDFTPQFIDWTPFIDRTWNRRLAEGLAAVTGENKPARRRR